MLDTFGMPSASDARYGAPPEASRSPLRFSSSVRVTKSMACCTSPSAIICANTRRCWSRKKSSGRRCSMAGFSALLSNKIAPRTERSASRLFGNGFSSVASAGISIRFIFAYSHSCSTSPAGAQAWICFRISTQSQLKLLRGLCVDVVRASIGVPVHRFGNLCKTFFRPPRRLILRLPTLPRLCMRLFVRGVHPRFGRESRSIKGRVSMAKMKVAQIPKPGADFEIVEREIPSPGAGHVRIRVQACGICHSDSVTKEGLFPGIQYPRVPGHEVAGVIDEVGSAVTGWEKGQRVGVGWHGGQDGTCIACRRGDFANCLNLKISGISYDGGYQEYMIAPVEALAAIPESLDAAEAGPLLCAGITTFNALRHSGALPSDLVAVQGVGGLGHLGIQFANKFGYKVAAIGRGPQNAALAKKLGAHHYIDSSAGSAAEQLKKLRAASVILATAPSSKSMSEIFHGLGRNGSLLVVGADMAPLEIPGAALINGRKRVQGWASGTPSDSEDTLRFAALTGVRAMIERFPLEKAAEAYARMLSGHAQFRVVLTM